MGGSSQSAQADFARVAATSSRQAAWVAALLSVFLVVGCGGSPAVPATPAAECRPC